MAKNLYNTGKVYKLVNDVDDKIYIGSTCNPLCKRICGHRADAKKHPERSVYKHLNTIGWPNVHIILIENYPCDNIEQLHSRERYYIDLLKPALNKVIPTRTDKEYYTANKDKISDQMKQYYTANKDKIIDRSKQYYTANKDKIIDHMKQYYTDNKDKIKDYYAIKYACSCGSNVNVHQKARHELSMKHKKFINEQKNPQN